MASASATSRLPGLFDDLVRCETRLYNAIGERLRAEHGVLASQFEFLRYLGAHPGCRVAEVAANFAAGIGAISKGMDRLEARGWARRAPNPADARSSLLSLTASGSALLADAEETFRRELGRLIGEHLSVEQIDAAAVAFERLRSVLEHDRVGLPVG